jgi:AcrR family transcriptional regulator
MEQQAVSGISAVDAANTLLSLEDCKGVSPTLLPKVPVQERGKVRFNAIIAAAEELVLEQNDESISPQKVAKRANVPTSSVYQYFPSMGAVYAVMAEKHFETAFQITTELLESTEVRSWRDLVDVMMESAFTFYSRDKLCELLFLGFFLGPGLHEFSNSRLSRLGLWYLEYFKILYKKSDLEPLPEKIAICIQVIETVFTRGLRADGEVREFYKEEAKVMISAYLGDFFASLEK